MYVQQTTRQVAQLTPQPETRTATSIVALLAPQPSKGKTATTPLADVDSPPGSSFEQVLATESNGKGTPQPDQTISNSSDVQPESSDGEAAVGQTDPSLIDGSLDPLGLTTAELSAPLGLPEGIIPVEVTAEAGVLSANPDQAEGTTLEALPVGLDTLANPIPAPDGRTQSETSANPTDQLISTGQAQTGLQGAATPAIPITSGIAPSKTQAAPDPALTPEALLDGQLEASEENPSLPPRPQLVGAGSSDKPSSKSTPQSNAKGLEAGAAGRTNNPVLASLTANASQAPTGDLVSFENLLANESDAPIEGLEPGSSFRANNQAQTANVANLSTAVAGRTPLTAEAIGARIVQAARNGETRFQIQLDPPELGRVDVKLEIGADGRANAVLSADRTETLDLLQRDIRTLERTLTQAGLQLDKGSIGFSLRQDTAGQQTGQDNQASNHGQALDKASGDEAETEPGQVSVYEWSGQVRPGGIDRTV